MDLDEVAHNEPPHPDLFCFEFSCITGNMIIAMGEYSVLGKYS